MNKENTLKILVVNLGDETDSRNVFCGIDKARVIFLKELKIKTLPVHMLLSEYVPTKIVVMRDGEIYSTGEYQQSSDGETLSDPPYDFFFTNKKKILAQDQLDGDIIEIIKNDWTADNLLVRISTYRTIGHDFNLVFHRNEIANKIMKVFNMTYHELSERKVIFKNQPPAKYISHY